MCQWMFRYKDWPSWKWLGSSSYMMKNFSSVQDWVNCFRDSLHGSRKPVFFLLYLWKLFDHSLLNIERSHWWKQENGTKLPKLRHMHIWKLNFMLVLICVSYSSIVVKFLYGAHPQHHGAANRQRKLTVTKFIQNVYRILTWLPYVPSDVLINIYL